MSARLFMTTDCIGGVWRYSIDVGDELSRRGWRVALAVTGPAPQDHHRDAARAAGCDLLWADVPLDWRAGSEAALDAGRRRLCGLAADWGADVVQLNQPAYGGEAWRIRHVVVTHSCVTTWWRAVKGEDPPPEWRWHAAAVSEGLGITQHAAPSRAFARAVAAAYPGAPAPRAVHNGARARRLAASAGKTPVVLAAGRVWDAAKNLLALDEAAREVTWPVVVAGPDRAPGGGRATLERCALLGALSAEDMAELQGVAAIFTAPSLYEPFGLAVLEAAQAGAALALADVPTFRELWGDAAQFFDPRSPAAIAETLNTLIDDEPLRIRLAAAARRRASDYDIAATASAMETLYVAARAAPQEAGTRVA